jgi:hypothetical protein
MKGAKAFIHLSSYEGNSYVCNEALAANLPCFVTKVGLFRDVTSLDAYIIDLKGRALKRRHVVNEFRRFLASLSQERYAPRLWVKEHATREVAMQKWRNVMEMYRKM